MNIVSLDLPATPSVCRRSVHWVPNIGQHVDDRLGTVTISQQSSVVPGAKLRVESYALHERPERATPGASAFRFTKLPNGEVYWTILDDSDAGRDTCTCDAGKYRGVCKHRDSLRALFAQGVFAELAEEAR